MGDDPPDIGALGAVGFAGAGFEADDESVLPDDVDDVDVSLELDVDDVSDDLEESDEDEESDAFEESEETPSEPDVAVAVLAPRLSFL